MKRVLICAAASAALLVPGAAFGGASSQSIYLGELDGVEGSEVRLKARHADGETNVVVITVRDVPVDCEGETEGTILPRVTLRGEIPVDGRDFAVKDDNGETTFKASGRLGARKSTGRFRYFGSMNLEGSTRECDTGGYSYTAER